MAKKLLIGLAALVAVVAIALYLLYSNLDSIVKAAIEKFGSEALQARVSVESVNLSPTGGEGRIAGLRIANPQGFQTPEALSFGEVAIKIDVSSLSGNPVVIREISIDRPRVTYEQGESQSNFAALQRNAEAYAKRFSADEASEKSAEKSEDGNGKRLIIDDLYIRDGKVGISHSALKGQALSAALPAIHLENIGKDKNGAAPAEVIDKLLSAISEAATHVARIDLDKALGQAGAAAKDAAPEKIDTLKNAIPGIVDKIPNPLGK